MQITADNPLNGWDGVGVLSLSSNVNRCEPEGVVCVCLCTTLRCVLQSFRCAELRLRSNNSRKAVDETDGTGRCGQNSEFLSAVVRRCCVSNLNKFVFV